MRKRTLLTFDPMVKHPSYTTLISLFVVDLVVGHRLQQDNAAQPPWWHTSIDLVWSPQSSLFWQAAQGNQRSPRIRERAA